MSHDCGAHERAPRPALPTLLLSPVLLRLYRRPPFTAATEMGAQFDEALERYAQRTPRFIPH